MVRPIVRKVALKPQQVAQFTFGGSSCEFEGDPTILPIQSGRHLFAKVGEVNFMLLVLKNRPWAGDVSLTLKGDELFSTGSVRVFSGGTNAHLADQTQRVWNMLIDTIKSIGWLPIQMNGRPVDLSFHVKIKKEVTLKKQ